MGYEASLAEGAQTAASAINFTGASMADEPEIEYEPETPELFLDAGGVWIADAAALCEMLGAVGFANDDGCAVALIPGKGEVSLGVALKAIKAKVAELRSIKGKPNDVA